MKDYNKKIEPLYKNILPIINSYFIQIILIITLIIINKQKLK